MGKCALITGITGQDGSYLTELLLARGYQVHGIIRRTSTFNTGRIDHIYQDPHKPNVSLHLHYSDLSVGDQLINLIYNLHPDEIYHLGAQSHVRVSFDMPEYTADITGLSTTRLLEAIRHSGVQTRFYQASSSEMFGNAPAPQSEATRFQPRSPYAAAKLYSAPERHIRSGNLSRRLSLMLASTGGNMSKLIRATYGPPRWTY